jgi:hypothetical protein
MFEALRNHAQHFGFPIQLVSYVHQVEGMPPTTRTRLSISSIAEIAVLEKKQ